jgi:hypothetical protein
MQLFGKPVIIGFKPTCVFFQSIDGLPKRQRFS